MAPRFEKRRGKRDTCAIPLRLHHLSAGMNGRRDYAPPSTVRAVSLPSPGQLSVTRKKQDKAPLSGDFAHLLKQHSPLNRVQPIVAKDHARSLGKSLNRRQERVSHPFVGHQPEARQGRDVALMHSPFYSGAMSEEAKANLNTVQSAMARAAKLAGRKADETRLIAISKTRSENEIRPLLAAGQRDFGENRVQEAQSKWPALRADYPDVTLHLVGQLQSNKAEEALALFDVIHSVDRLSLVSALSKAQDKLSKRPRCFIQVNIGDEPQKGGCAVADLPQLIAGATSLDVVGLMAVPPEGLEAAPFFAFLAKLARDHGLDQLSMGMSGDFETAIMLGATYVRIGTALFGARA
jgi:PLP dependent protein